MQEMGMGEENGGIMERGERMKEKEGKGGEKRVRGNMNT